MILCKACFEERGEQVETEDDSWVPLDTPQVAVVVVVRYCPHGHVRGVGTIRAVEGKHKRTTWAPVEDPEGAVYWP
jgi:hypothetical protein